MYFDTAYIAKFYLNEPESPSVRELVRNTGVIHSSIWAYAEFHALLHRCVREGSAKASDGRRLVASFSEHTEAGLWRLLPVTEALLRRTSARLIAAPHDMFIRTADAVHLTAAQELGETEIWTNDRHMLAAAGYFGLIGRSV